MMRNAWYDDPKLIELGHAPARKGDREVSVHDLKPIRREVTTANGEHLCDECEKPIHGAMHVRHAHESYPEAYPHDPAYFHSACVEAHEHGCKCLECETFDLADDEERIAIHTAGCAEDRTKMIRNRRQKEQPPSPAVSRSAARAREVSKLLSKQERELAKQYQWKAENIVRFFRELGMTEEQKVKFLAKELAGAYLAGTWQNAERLCPATAKRANRRGKSDAPHGPGQD